VDRAAALPGRAGARCAESAAARLPARAAARAAVVRCAESGLSVSSPPPRRCDRRAAEANPMAFPEKKLNGRHLDLFSLYKQVCAQRGARYQGLCRPAAHASR
jgi:hypothetical protein